MKKGEFKKHLAYYLVIVIIFTMFPINIVRAETYEGEENNEGDVTAKTSTEMQSEKFVKSLEGVTLPIVQTTSSAISVTTSSAIVVGNVTSDGNGTLSEVGIVYGTTTNPEIATATTESAINVVIDEEFRVSLSGLTSDTTYYARAYAINQAGTAYADEISFTTKSAPITAYTVKFDSQGGSEVSSITTTSGAIIVEPTAPKKSGYTFVDWYKESTLKNQWDFDSDVVIGNTTLYAKWKRKSSGSSSKSSKSSESDTESDKAIVKVNGKTHNVGTKKVEKNNGIKTVTIDINKKSINKEIDEVIKGEKQQNNIIEIPIETDDADEYISVLTGDIIKKMEDNNFEVNVHTKDVEYILPASEVDIQKIAEQLKIDQEQLDDIEVDIQIKKIADEKTKAIKEQAKANKQEILFTPMSFEVKAKTTLTSGKEKEVVISKFNQYVERIMEIPEGVDLSKITTGIVYNEDGTFSHVPTTVIEKNGKYYAKLNSLTNSIYSVIYNPVEVVSVENHWSKEAVNDMADRLIVTDIKSFMPDEAVTRGEFAEYMVKAVGLYRTDVAQADIYKDISVDNSYADIITIGTEYGIINGYSDGTFRVNEVITREEAMTIFARVMAIIKLEGNEAKRIEGYTDKGDVSEWAYASVEKTLSGNVFNGRTQKTIVPQGTITKAEALQAAKNLLEQANLIN